MAHPAPLLLALAAAAAVLACRGPASTPLTPNAQQPGARMTPTPQAAAFSPARNQTFSVVLPGLATAGYEWHLTAGFDARIVREAGKRVGELPAGAGIGASADEIFDFQAIGAGATTLVFTQYRPWEGPSQAAETRKYTVTVK